MPTSKAIVPVRLSQRSVTKIAEVGSSRMLSMMPPPPPPLFSLHDDSSAVSDGCDRVGRSGRVADLSSDRDEHAAKTTVIADMTTAFLTRAACHRGPVMDVGRSAPVSNTQDEDNHSHDRQRYCSPPTAEPSVTSTSSSLSAPKKIPGQERATDENEGEHN
jgi:hypothetical protein